MFWGTQIFDKQYPDQQNNIRYFFIFASITAPFAGLMICTYYDSNFISQKIKNVPQLIKQDVEILERLKFCTQIGGFALISSGISAEGSNFIIQSIGIWLV